MRILKPTIPKPIQAKVLKPSPKVVPKIKPVPVVDKVVPETTVQRQQIKTPVVKITSPVAVLETPVGISETPVVLAGWNGTQLAHLLRNW